MIKQEWDCRRQNPSRARCGDPLTLGREESAVAMFERFTERARRVIILAQEEAKRLNHSAVGTEHILLGIIREGEGVAPRVLEAMGADLDRVRAQVVYLLGEEGTTSYTKQASKTPT